MNNVLLVLKLKWNLISVSRLIDYGYTIMFDSSIHVMIDRGLICPGALHGYLYCLNLIFLILNNTEQVNLIPQKRKVSSINSTYLWHLRLGHFNIKWIQRLVEDEPLGSLELEDPPHNESCL